MPDPASPPTSANLSASPSARGISVLSVASSRERPANGNDGRQAKRTWEARASEQRLRRPVVRSDHARPDGLRPTLAKSGSDRVMTERRRCRTLLMGPLGPLDHRNRGAHMTATTSLLDIARRDLADLNDRIVGPGDPDYDDAASRSQRHDRPTSGGDRPLLERRRGRPLHRVRACPRRSDRRARRWTQRRRPWRRRRRGRHRPRGHGRGYGRSGLRQRPCRRRLHLGRGRSGHQRSTAARHRRGSSRRPASAGLRSAAGSAT